MNIVANNCNRETTAHISKENLWISRFFFNIKLNEKNTSDRMFIREMLSRDETRPGTKRSMSMVKFLTA